MFVKICGTTSAADAELAVALGADALGFIFAPSKRRVTVEQVAAITPKLPPHVERVGVFTDPDVEEIARTVQAAGLTAVQMHWPYEHAFVSLIREALGPEVRLWQVLGYAVDPADAESASRHFTLQLRAALLDTRLDLVLLDAEKGGASGGLGQTFSWERASAALNKARWAADAAAEARGTERVRIAVAGGLRTENVAEAIAALRPFGVDVVSGVEASPGLKDPDRLRTFIQAARQAGGALPPL